VWISDSVAAVYRIYEDGTLETLDATATRSGFEIDYAYDSDFLAVEGNVVLEPVAAR
jgi:hypothetical protein